VCDAVDASGDVDYEGARAARATYSALARGRPPRALEIIEALERDVGADALGAGAEGGAGAGAGCG